MAAKTTTDTLITTKLHRPTLDRIHVHRPHLLKRLDQRRSRPLTLVSAPAGYGKSVLIRSWLESRDIPSAWVSLDKNDNDLRTFAAYFVAAVETLFSGACRNTKALLTASDLPPGEVLSANLLNELDIEGANVERIGEGIKITFSSGILFDVDKSNLKDPYKGELSQLAVILNKYEDTNILLAGHTDSTGSDEYNFGLSERHAQSVANYLASQNVNYARFSTEGYGKTDPIASNETAEGRAQNRRVEVAIWANEKLKKVAKDKTS